MTFSLIARCEATGMLGGVVATSSPAVGSRCLFTRAGVGAVLTQFWTDPRMGPRGLSLLAEGLPAAYVANALAASTPDHDWRQLAVVDAQGRTGFFHGTRVKGAMAAAQGPECVAIGNILANDKVPAAMVDAFLDPGSLPERLLRALEAGLAAGGESKPLMSAAMQISNQASFPYIDLRIDVSDEPIAGLRSAWEAFAPHADMITGRAIAPRGMPQGSLA